MIGKNTSMDRSMLKRKTMVAVVATAFMALSLGSQAQVVISEFMANNDNTLVDGDGNYSDWIELYNLSSNAVDLTGWFLSDSTNNPMQWTFPPTSMAGGEYLVVFASGQAEDDYTDRLGYLHTTFKLSANGESVILTQPGGVTMAHAFMDYPEQDDDISYGLGQDASFSTLIVEEQDARALIPSSEPASTWNTTSYDDAGWLSGLTGVGYERNGSTYGAMINLDVGDMFQNTRSIYIRIPFEVDDPDAVSLLTLRLKYDDGFVAYINGTEVASENVPASPTYQSRASGAHGGTAYEDFTLPNPSLYLQAGENVLAIHAMDYPSPPPDLFIMPLLNGTMGGDIQINSALYLTSPTPGTANVSGVLGYVKDTSFSVDRGFYTDAFDVEISCGTDEASIYYTVDGTTPAADNGTLYAGAIPINRTTVLRAAAFVTGYQPSDTDTQTYLFLDDIIGQGADASSLAPAWPSGSVNGQALDYAMDPDVVNDPTYADLIDDALLDIPSISIVTDPDHLFDPGSGIYVNPQDDGSAWERETSVELINPDGTDGFQINGGIRIRGGSSRASSNPKHSFRLFFRSEYGTSRLNYKLFGDEGADSFKRMDLRTGQNFSWNHGNSGDKATWLYDTFTRDAHREMGQPYTRGRFYHLYLNGMYWGLYQTEERPDARYGESYYGDDSDDYDIVKSGDSRGLIEATDGVLDNYQDLWTAVNAGVSSDSAYFAIQGMNADGTENESGTRLLDVDNLIDYMLCVYYTGNRDSPLGGPGRGSMPRNLFALYNRTTPDGFKFVAHDGEHCLGYHLSAGVNYDFINDYPVMSTASLTTMAYFNPWWLHLKLLDNDEYVLRFADRVRRHFFNEGILTPERAAALVTNRKEEMEMAIIAESARWGDYRTATPRTRNDDWLPAVNSIFNSYLQASPNTRRDVVFSQIQAEGWYPGVDAPGFSQHGGSMASGFSLSISGAGQVYYTTDGSDPRAVGGTVAGTAYSSPLTVALSTHVKARVRSGSTWSALTEATFVVDEDSPLRVTEIMYYPAMATAGVETNYPASDFEFIELLNTGSQAVGLAGTAFSKGITFEFNNGDVPTLGPGEYVVLVNNLEAFTARYPNAGSIHIAGEYHGKFFLPDAALDNGGEDLVLEDGLGRTILDFAYSDWYEITDGGGYSLTLIDPTAATSTWGDSLSWRPSAQVGGTPGEGPEDFPSPGDLVINEILTHQDQDVPGDWVELVNTSSTTIDINGWFLSDDEDALDKVQLSGLSSLAPGAYLVLSEASHFGATVAGLNGFGLSELGDAVYLSSGDGSTLTGYRIEQSFGAAERDVTFGRHILSDAEVDFTAQSEATSLASNSYPRIGPVVISELLYRPADSNHFEFIELYNSATTNVPLYNTATPANTWRLDGALTFTFPEGLSLGPGESLLITETNRDAFMNRYTVPDGVTVLGPYDGKLNNGGEAVQLIRPGEPETGTGEIPYILVERVAYDNQAPWPTLANTGGVSLVRVDPALYGNDPSSWTTGPDLSPGTVDFTVPDPDADGDGMPDTWETANFGATDAVDGGANDDWDNDGASNYNEWRAGTDPTSAESVLAFISQEVASGHVLSWSSVEDKTYSIWRSTDLIVGFDESVLTGILATPPMNTQVLSTETAERVFYRLTVEDE